LAQVQKCQFTGASHKTGWEGGELIAASKTAAKLLSSSSADEGLDLEEAELSGLEGMSLPSSPCALATPSPRSTAADTQDEDLERCAWEATCRALGLKPLDFDPASFDATSGSGTPEADKLQDARVQFCIKEPLAFTEDELHGESCSLRTPSPCSLRTPSPLYDNKAAWCWMQTSENKASKATAWADQLTSDDEMGSMFSRSRTTRFSSHPHASQTSDLSFPLTPGFPAQRETLVLSLASML